MHATRSRVTVCYFLWAVCDRRTTCVKPAGLNILRGFLEPDSAEASAAAAAANQRTLASLASADGSGLGGLGLARRVIACLDVRSNDSGAQLVRAVVGVGCVRVGRWLVYGSCFGARA